MAGSNPVPWAADQHTKAKHAVYAQYLDKWMPIMVNGWGANITYAEGFAGPGVYLDGSPGSPVIAVKALVGNEEIRTKVRNGGIRFVFIDRDQRCTDLLPKELAKATEPVPLGGLSAYGVHVSVEKGDCEPDLQRVLTREQAWGRPILAVLDTWGGAISFDLVQRVAENPGSEVIITMQPQYFARFASVNSIEHGDRVFGDASWRDVAGQPPEKKDRWLLQRYRRTIQQAGFQYVLDFELIDKRGQSLFLVFGTTHEKGLTKMKEAMWEVDDIAGVGYRDPRDPNQEALAIEIEPNTAPLKRLIVDHLRATPENQATLNELRKFALRSTVYKESQAASVVREMVADGQLVRGGGRSNGSRLSFMDVVKLPG